MSKFILLALCLLVLANSQSDALLNCLKEKCPDQYNKCLAETGCEALLKKCVAKCGEKINYLCYATCVGATGTASNVCYCAVNNGCITNVSVFQQIKEFFEAVTEKDAFPNA